MGRNHTFMDREFATSRYDYSDSGTYTRNLVGIAMPFEGENSGQVYSIIREECLNFGLFPKRVDEYTRSGIVVKDIAELIEKSEYLIFDLSYERQNVYYELGYAHGVGNEAEDILIIAEKGTKLHYDIAGLRVQHFKLEDDLRKILRDFLPNRK
jgi:hypothetical protein